MNDTPTRTRWLIVALIFCMGVLMFIDRVNISIPWKVLLGRADLWFLTASYFVLGYIIYIYFSWFYLYLVNVRGFSVLICRRCPGLVGRAALARRASGTGDRIARNR